MAKVKLLSEICSPKQWKTISSNMLLGSGYPVYGANGVIGYYSEYNHEKRTLLITCRGATCGSLNICVPYSYVNGNAMALDDLSADIYIQYLYYYLQFRGFSDIITGSAQPQIVRQSLEKVRIYYPEMEEQQRVATVLNNVEKLISLRKQQLAKLDELVKARFVEMFGDGDYPYQDLIELIVKDAGLSYGIVQPGDDGTGDMGVIRPVDLVDGGISISSIKYIDRHIGDSFKKTELAGNELLITVRGTTGITALTDNRFSGMNVTRGIAVIRYDTTKINPIYLNEYFKTSTSQNYIQERTRGATLQQINLSDLRAQPILVPPRTVQNIFANFVEQMNNFKLTIQQSLDKLKVLKKALMQEYFG